MGWVEDAGIGGGDHPLVNDAINPRDAGGVREEDAVTARNFVQPEKWRPEGRPVAGDTHIAGLARQRRSRVVARPHLQICFGHTLHHVPAEAYGRYDQVVEGAAGGRDGEGGAYKSLLASRRLLGWLCRRASRAGTSRPGTSRTGTAELALAATAPAAACVPGAAAVDLLTGTVAGGT